MNDLETLYAEALAEKTTFSTPQSSVPNTPINGNGSSRIERCRAYLERMPDAISGSGGHDQTFAAACRIVEFVGDDPAAAWDLLQWWNVNKCNPPWSERELQHKLADAMHNTDINPDFQDRWSESFYNRTQPVVRSAATKNDGLPSVVRDTNKKEQKLFVPLQAASNFLERYITHDGLSLIRRFDQCWYMYNGSRYLKLDDEEIQSLIWQSLDDQGLSPTRHKVGEVEAALRSINGVLIGVGQEEPFWINQDGNADEMLLVRNGILDVRTGALSPATPMFFSLNQSAAGFDPEADCSDWLVFLKQAFAGDADQIRLLQQWFGLCITRRTDFQKILLLLGPVRSGKGTIQFILEHLVGPDGSASLTSSQISSRFGFAAFAEKQIAAFTDLRIGSRVDQAAVSEHLLTASGGDLLPIERKFREVKNARCKARIAILSNELPGFLDTAGALAARMLYLQTKVSFEGRENPKLRQGLLKEISGILNWATEGYRDLLDHGFTQPASTAYLRDDMRELCSPIRAWADQCAVIKSGTEWSCAECFESWKKFTIEGNYPTGNERSFGRRLRETFPMVARIQKRIAGRRVWVYSGIRERGQFEPDEGEG